MAVPKIVRLKKTVFGGDRPGKPVEFPPGEYFVSRTFPESGNVVITDLKGNTAYVADFEVEVLSP